MFNDRSRRVEVVPRKINVSKTNVETGADYAGPPQNQVERIRFEPGKLGIQLEMTSGQVTRVDQESQAERKGVAVGWILKYVDGNPFTEHLLYVTISDGHPYELTFDKAASVKRGRKRWLEKIKFEPGRLGIEVEMDTGQVSKVDAESQAGRKGVRLNWRLQWIDDKPFSEDLLRATTSSGYPYELAFQMTPLSQGATRRLEKIMFEPGRLGIEVEMDTGQVIKVDAESQAGRKGVQLHWLVKLIDDKPFSEDLLRATTSSGHQFELAFQMSKNCRQRDLALIQAAKRGDSARIIEIFERGGDIDRTDKDGIPQVCFAVLHGHVAAVRTLCGLAANINKTDARGKTALAHAVDRGHNDIANSLCMSQADVNIVGSDGWSPLHLAVKNRDAEVLHMLCAPDANKEITQSLHGFTPLLLAVLDGEAELSRILCQEGADPDNPGNLAMPPLCFASVSGFLEVVVVLCDFSASIEKGTSNGRTPMAIAAHGGHEDIVRFLCERQGNTNIVDQYGWTPLFQAVHVGLPHLVYTLCEYEGDANMIDKHGRSALGLAASHGNIGIVQILYDFGAHVDRVGERCTPLYEASHAGHIDVVRTLIACGAHAGSQAALKAQVVASQNGHQKVAKYLAQEDR